MEFIKEFKMSDQNKTREQLLEEIKTLKEKYRILRKKEEENIKTGLRNKAMLTALPDMFFHLDKNGIFLDYHVHKEDLLYVRSEDFLYKKITDVMPLDIAQKTIEITKEVLESGKILSFEYDLQLGNEMKSYEARFSTFDKNSVIVLTRDITEKKALHKSHLKFLEKFKSLTENLNVGVYRTTAVHKGRFIEANPALIKMFGFNNKEELFSINVADLYLHHEDREELKRIMLEKGFVRNKELNLRKKDGTMIIASISTVAVKDEKGILKYYDGIIEEITERKRAEQDLRESEEKFRILAENIPAVIYLSLNDEQKTLVYLNDEIENLTGYTKEDFLKKRINFSDLYYQNDEANIILTKENSLQNKKSFYLIYRIIDKDGKMRWVEEYGMGVLREKKVILLEGFMIDISARKQAEEQVKKDLKEKVVLLQEIHHRVKNNMQVVSSLLRMQSKYFRDEFDKKLILDSRNRVNSMALIHESLYQSKDLSQIDFEYYIKTLCGHLISTFGVKAERIKFKQNINKIFLDINKAIPCGLIINELISNSIKYAFPDDKAGEISIHMELKNNEYTLTVFDNGEGLPDDIDFQNPESLGLQLISALTKQLHGKIDLNRRNGTYYIIKFEKEFKR